MIVNTVGTLLENRILYWVGLGLSDRNHSVLVLQYIDALQLVASTILDCLL